MADYPFDQAWQHESERLTALEQALDPGTIHHLEALGVGPGWRCWEVGAGAGSIAAWLCQRVGDEGHVMATDLEMTFLERLSYPIWHFFGTTLLPTIFPKAARSISCMRAGCWSGFPTVEKPSHVWSRRLSPAGGC